MTRGPRLRLSRISIARCADVIRSSASAGGPLSQSVHRVTGAPRHGPTSQRTGPSAGRRPGFDEARDNHGCPRSDLPPLSPAVMTVEAMGTPAYQAAFCASGADAVRGALAEVGPGRPAGQAAVRADVEVSPVFGQGGCRRCANDANPDGNERIRRLDDQIPQLTAERDRIADGGEIDAASDDRMLEEFLAFTYAERHRDLGRPPPCSRPSWTPTSPRYCPLPGADQAPIRPRRPHQRIRAGRAALESHGVRRTRYGPTRQVTLPGCS